MPAHDWSLIKIAEWFAVDADGITWQRVFLPPGKPCPCEWCGVQIDAVLAYRRITGGAVRCEQHAVTMAGFKFPQRKEKPDAPE